MPPQRLGASILAELPGNTVEYFSGNWNPPVHDLGNKEAPLRLIGCASFLTEGILNGNPIRISEVVFVNT